MKRLFLIVVTVVLALFFSIPAESKQPKYRALFNLGSDAKYYKYVDYKSSNIVDRMVLIDILDKRPDPEKTYDEDVQYLYDEILVLGSDQDNYLIL